jgi:ABC-type Fe3+ transport system permease subunit
MRTLRTQAVVLGLLYLCFLGSLVLAVQQLPDRVASHFNGSGQPDGWMSRSAHLLFMGGFGFAFPLFVVGICFLLRFMPVGGFNLPHRDYWLAPERRTETFAYFFRHSLWFACMAVGFAIGLHLLVIQANAQPQARLSTPMILGLAGCFLAGVAAWVASMVLHFGRPRPAQKTHH